MNISKIFEKEPEDLLNWILDTFPVLRENIEEIHTIEDMEKASNSLVTLTNTYSYLCTLLSYAKVNVRRAKRELSKAEHEDMIDRKDILQSMVDLTKQKYAAISRAVTIKIENNHELQMNRNFVER